jgi:hypothetical protein
LRQSRLSCAGLLPNENVLTYDSAPKENLFIGNNKINYIMLQIPLFPGI